MDWDQVGVSRGWQLRVQSSESHPSSMSKVAHSQAQLLIRSLAGAVAQDTDVWPRHLPWAYYGLAAGF